MESFQILPPGGVAPLSVNISFWPKRLLARVFFWNFFGSFQNLGQNTTYIKILEGCFLFNLFYRPKCKQSNAIRPLRPCKGQTNDLTLLRPNYFGSGHCQLSAGTNIFIFWPQTPEKMDKKWVQSCLVFWLTWQSLITVCNFFCFGKMVCGLHFDHFLRCLWSENKIFGSCWKLTMSRTKNVLASKVWGH